MRQSALILLFLLSVFVASGQNNTNSPYSVFGIGELEYTGGGKNMAMGESGIALRSEISLNTTNPASLTAIPMQSLATDFGINFKLTNLANEYKSANVLNGNISWATLAFPINRRIAMSFSLNPKSSIGYTIYSSKNLEGTNTSYPVTYKGEGGLNEASLSLGGLITKKISIGMSSSVIWGSLVKTTDQISSASSTITRIDNTHYSGINFKPGFQYQINLGSKTILTIGGIAEFSSYLNGSSDLTISSGTETIVSKTQQESQIRLPFNAGTGVALEINGRYLLTFDYERSDWKSSDINFDTQRLSVNNSYHVGIEIAPKFDLQRLAQVKRYRIGMLYQTGYLNIYGTQIGNYAATCGVSLPIMKDRNFINISMEVGRQGTFQNQLIRETYAKMNFSFNFWEHWFSPRKYN